MATPKHRGGGNAVGDEDPTRLFNSPIDDEELTLGLAELGESRTMAVAPEDNEALLNELLSSPISSPLGDGPLPGAISGSLSPGGDGAAARGWTVNVKDAHPADREQSTVAVAQLDAPTLAFKAQHSQQQTEKARTEYQRMLSTQPLTVQRNPGTAVPQGTAIMTLPQLTSQGPQARSGPPVPAQTSVMPLPQYPPQPYSQQPAPPRQMGQPYSQGGSGPYSAIPHIVPGAQKMPAVVIKKKKSRGGKGMVVAFLVLALLGGGGFYGIRTHRVTLPTGLFAAKPPATPAQPIAQPAAAAVAPPADEKVAVPTQLAPSSAPPPSAPPSAAIDPAALAGTTPAPATSEVPVAAAPAAAQASDSHRRRRDTAKTNGEPPVAGGAPEAKPAEPKPAEPKPAEPKPAAEAKPAKPGKGAKPASDTPPSTAAEEEEMKKATETLTNSL